MMTEQQFDARLQVIEDQTAARQEQVDGYRDQAMARLFLESEWSQDDLAAHLAKRWGREVSRQWVSYHLRFGRFLSFFATGCGENEAHGVTFRLPPNLTEGKFRELWEGTEAGGNFGGRGSYSEAAVADERRRFGEVVEELKRLGLHRQPKPLMDTIVALLIRSGWLTFEEIHRRVAAKLDGIVTTKDVQVCLGRTIRPKPGFPYRVEKIGEGPTGKYRLVKVKGNVMDRKQVRQMTHEL